MKKIVVILLLIFVAIAIWACSKQNRTINSIELWLDENGEQINAHGGGVLYKDNKYYWYGEHKSDSTNRALVGITCYSSDNLINWQNEGIALAVVDDDDSDISRGCVLERPKVIYNEKTKQYVMWFHLELKGKGYASARAGVAISDNPTGPFNFLRSSRINAGKLPSDINDSNIAILDSLDIDNYKKWWTPEWFDAIKKGLFLKRDLANGQMSRDMTLFVDDDAKAYHIYSSEDNLTLHIAELNDDYLNHTGKYVRLDPTGHNEAPTIFKSNGKYWMINSGCTGWEPNEARMFSADNIYGPWTKHDNPCKGYKSEITFGGQGTYILKVENKKESFIFMADMWNPNKHSDGRYIWLPISFKNNMPEIEWKEKWSLSDLK